MRGHQVVTQAGGVTGAAVVGDPRQKRITVQIDTVAVHTNKRPVERHITALGVAVGMLA